MPVLMYGSETMIWKEKEMSRIRAVQMDNLRGLLGITFDHVERMENERITKKVYVGECAGISSLGRLQKSWIDSVRYCLKKRDLAVNQANRMGHDRIEWWMFVRVNSCGVTRKMSP